MTNKDLDRLDELSSREITDEEGIEHFELRNKIEGELEKAELWNLECNLSCSNGTSAEYATRLEKEKMEQSFKIIDLEQENKQLKEDNSKYNHILAQALYKECINCNHDINSHYGKNESAKIQQCHNSDERYNQCKCVNPLTERDNLKQILEKIKDNKHLDKLYIESLKEDIKNCNSESKRFREVYVNIKELRDEEPRHFGIYYLDKLKEILDSQEKE
ncbi:hypothetical protein LCGC14_0372080 [marine sediment metagenome]|uniref:Uncharacterized protein n=1 Tax=marine sediment metagenome TaxID=412755 RepID=A0A0F9TML7_9ZZZZ